MRKQVSEGRALGVTKTPKATFLSISVTRDVEGEVYLFIGYKHH